MGGEGGLKVVWGLAGEKEVFFGCRTGQFYMFGLWKGGFEEETKKRVCILLAK